ncbi:alcohol dehydrogenase [Atractiella rhizophila]|nr:alcohol dehydrogenase [Atractiella rhizophila]
MATTMKALVVKGPFKVAVEDRDIPVPQSPGDVIVKVTTSALCGSDLHVYRGREDNATWNFVMGHEFVGVIHSLHPQTTVKSFKIGDKVISPFTISCGDCFFCQKGWTSRCEQSVLFGCPKLDGGQAEYVRVPLAESTLFHAPTDIKEANLIILADILPTGLFAAKNAWSMLNEEERKDAIAVVLGCGPVGLCAITAAVQRFSKVIAIDSVPERLAQAEEHGAITVNLQSSSPTPKEFILSHTNGRGADAALEIVGSPDALKLGIDLVRNGGVVASVGVHGPKIELEGSLLYNKNVRLQFGRCPVRALFPEALELLKKISKESDLFERFVQKRVGLSEAPLYYQLFNEQKVGKTVFNGV